jgi:hypothetical protein
MQSSQKFASQVDRAIITIWEESSELFSLI